MLGIVVYVSGKLSLVIINPAQPGRWSPPRPPTGAGWIFEYRPYQRR